MTANACNELCWVRTVHCETEIQRSSDDLFNIISTPLNDSRWMFGLTATDLPTPGAMQQGTRMVCKFGLGSLVFMKAHAVIDEFEPGRRFVRRRVGGKLAMTGEFLVEPAGNASRLRWTMHVGLDVFLLDFFLNPLIAQWMKMSIALSLRKLKALAESAHGSTVKVNQRASHAS